MKVKKFKMFFFKGIAILISLLLTADIFTVMPTKIIFAASGTTYYIDSIAGNDSNNGTGESTPWKSLAKVNSITFQPGDTILFKAGSLWSGQQLCPKGSGTAGRPITIDMYGAGNKPRFDGNGSADSTINFYNQQYWEINNLEITNNAVGVPDNGTSVSAADGNKLLDYRGIHVAGQDAGVLEHFYLKGLYIHDVTGEVDWISGNTSGDGNGIYHAKGWDGSKRTGGILFEVLQPGTNPIKTKFNDVDIENCVLKDNSFGGIIFKQYNNGVNWANRDDGEADEDWYPHTNITIKNNYLSQYNSDFACDTIYLTSVQHVLVDHNISAGAGTSGIELYYTDDVTVQYNEVYDTTVKAGGADSNGIDPDKEATNALIQYNYVHDTGDGILLCGFVYGSSILRYNVVKDASKRYINPHSNKGTYLLYNNIFYNTKTTSNISLVDSSGGSGFMNDTNCFYKFYNNIFYNAASTSGQTLTIGTGTGITYDSNSYYGNNVSAPAADSHAVRSDLKFADPMPTASNKGTLSGNPSVKDSASFSPYLSLDGFKLLSGSAAIGNGLDETTIKSYATQAPIPDTFTIDNGGKDFFGNSLYNGKSDIGAYEYYGDTAAVTEAITGSVKDNAGNLISGATVSLTTGGNSYSAVTDSYGFYSMENVPVGTGYTLTASLTGYTDGTAAADVTAGNTTSGVDLTIISTNPTGTIAGLVKEITGSTAALISGATVTASVSGSVYGTTVTDENGAYDISDLPVRTGYSVTASKTGYQPWTVTTLSGADLKVTAGMTTNVPDIYIFKGKPDYLINDNFDSSETGSAPVNWSTTTTVSGDSVAIADFPSASDKSVLISQPTKGTSGHRTSLYKNLDAVTGILTVEYSINKSNTNQYFCLPYIYGDTAGSSTALAVCMAMDNSGNIVYKDNGKTGSSHTIMSYSANTWYKFKIIANTITKKYDIYINDEKKVDQASFRYTTSVTDSLNKLEYYVDYAATGSVYLNNFRVSTGIAYPVDDTDLSQLKVSYGTLNEQNYVNVPNYIDSITVTPTADSIFVNNITVNGVPVVSGQESQSISLNEGDNIIPIAVTAEDGTTTETYNITVSRTPAAIDATLRDLAISAGTLSPAFSTENLSYTASVPYSVKQITLTPTASVNGANILINDTNVVNGQASKGFALLEGNNTFKLEVTSADGTCVQDYTVIVSREYNPNGYIAGQINDNLGNQIVGAEVSVSVDGSVYSAVTDKIGNYKISDIAPGTGYTLTASKTGYKDGIASAVGVTAGNTTTANIIMNIDVSVNSGTVAGKVTDNLGNQLQGVTVSMTVYGSVYSAITDSVGTYIISNIPEATGCSLTASKSGYTDVIISGMDITNGKLSVADITMNLIVPSTCGSITGKVTDNSGNLLQGVNVSMTVSGSVYSATTDSAGRYIMANIPAGAGYTVTASKTGYNDGSVTVDVAENTETTGADIILTAANYTIVVNSEKGASSVTIGKTLQMSADISSDSAADIKFKWSVYAGTGTATIDINGLLTATGVGTVTVMATADDGSGISGSKIITITEASGRRNNIVIHSPVVTTPVITTSKDSVTAITTLKAVTDVNGSAVATVTQTQITEAAAKAVENVNAKGAGKAIVEVEIEDTTSAGSVSASIPKGAISSILESKVYALTIKTPVAAVTLNQKVLSAIAEKAKGDIKITTSKVGASTLSDEAKPVYEVTIVSGNETISFPGSGNIRVSIPYTLKSGEDANNIVVSSISESGDTVKLTHSQYDAATGVIIIVTSNPSKYIIGNEKIDFKDNSGWYADYVNYLAARGILKGSDGIFSPEKNITRAEFVQILANMSEADSSKQKASVFSDVNNTDWYSNAVQWAYENGVATGSDGKFDPAANISRQDMAVMISRYAQKVENFILGANNSSVNFSDSAKIADYAKSAVKAMLESGIISGKEDNTFAPTENASRAEAAKMVAVLLQNILGNK